MHMPVVGSGGVELDAQSKRQQPITEGEEMNVQLRCFLLLVSKEGRSEEGVYAQRAALHAGRRVLCSFLPKKLIVCCVSGHC